MSWGQLEYSVSISQLKEKEKNEENIKFLNSIKNNDMNAFFHFIETGADVNCVVNEETPLLYAMDYDNIDIFSLLINFNADVNYEFDNYSLIWKTIWQKKNDFFKLLINKISKKTRERNTGKTILMEAVRYSNLEAVKATVLAGFNINDKDNKGNTALHYALGKENMNENDLEIIKFLIAAGADVLSKNANGNTPEDVVKEDISPSTENTITHQNNTGGKKKYKKNNNPKYRPK